MNKILQIAIDNVYTKHNYLNKSIKDMIACEVKKAYALGYKFGYKKGRRSGVGLGRLIEQKHK